MFLTIFTILGNLIPSILQNRGVIGQSTDNLISGLLGPAEALIAALRSGQSKTNDYLAVLAAAAGVIAVLKSTTNLPADTLTQIAGVDKDIQAALAGYAKAGAGFDPTIYVQTPEVV